MLRPNRGEIWLADLDPSRRHEQAGRRPMLVVSEDLFNHGPADLVIVIPLTAVYRGIPSHVPITPPEGGLKKMSFVMCEMIRSIAKERLVVRRGRISGSTLTRVEDGLRILLRL
ncbi:MAG: type II toxin-antitoxin system PemK/MazF family toxin [Chloroflexota bacterium]